MRRTSKLPDSWLDHVAESLGKNPHSDQIAALIWASNRRKKHNLDSRYFSIGFDELDKKFGRAKGKEVLEGAELYKVLDDYSEGSTRRFRELPRVNEIRANYINKVTRGEFEPYEYPELSSFEHLDAKGNKSTAKHAIPAMVEVPIKELDGFILDESNELEHRWQAAKIRVCLDNNGCILQRYREGRGGRVFIRGISLQSTTAKVIKCVFKDCWNYDLQNCYPTIYAHKANEFGLASRTPTLAAYVADPAAMIKMLQEYMGCDRKQIKGALLVLSHLGGVRGVLSSPKCTFSREEVERLLSHPTVTELKREFKLVADVWIAVTRKQKGRWLVNEKGKGAPRSLLSPQNHAALLSHLLQGIEALAQEAVRSHYAKWLLLLMHDGWLSKVRLSTTALEREIEQATGVKFTVTEEQFQGCNPSIKPKKCFSRKASVHAGCRGVSERAVSSNRKAASASFPPGLALPPASCCFACLYAYLKQKRTAELKRGLNAESETPNPKRSASIDSKVSQGPSVQ